MLKRLIFYLVNKSPNSVRRIILIFSDVILISFVYFLGINLLNHDFNINYYSLLITVSVPIFLITGQYKAITRYIDNNFLYLISLRTLLGLILIQIISKIYEIESAKIFLLIFLWFFISLSLGFVRALFKNLFSFIKNSKILLKIIAIYGAGEAGNQLLASLKLDKRFKTIYFFDDAQKKQNRFISGIPIMNPKNIQKYSKNFDEIFIAIPSLKKEKMRALLRSLEDLNMPVLQIPSIEDISSGRATIDTLKPISVENILGRDPVPINYALLKKEIKDKVICVTGAGGSIGSELCRQIKKLKPNLILMIDCNEFFLYKIQEEFLREDSKIPVKAILGNTTDIDFLRNLFAIYKIDIVFHAAAYKHVPIVEENPFQGVFNNVFSTLNVCRVSEEYSIAHVLLISTDKAVRPTNIMGASKRISELILQAFSSKDIITKFCIVRFGNVLGSSGSVVPKFREQLAKGGPLTITHPEVVRYFMTIPEATLLVIQSLSLSNGGDILLLDMGKQVKIKDLAIKMIKLSGSSVKDESNKNGDIEIVYTGLRKGEKLFEELLIDAKAEKTNHPSIFRAKEKSIDYEFLSNKLKEVENSIKKNDLENLIFYLKQLVPELNNKK